MMKQKRERRDERFLLLSAAHVKFRAFFHVCTGPLALLLQLLQLRCSPNPTSHSFLCALHTSGDRDSSQQHCHDLGRDDAFLPPTKRNIRSM